MSKQNRQTEADGSSTWRKSQRQSYRRRYTPACCGKNVRTHNKNPSFSCSFNNLPPPLGVGAGRERNQRRHPNRQTASSPPSRGPFAARLRPDSFAFPLHADLTGRAVSGGRQPAPFGLLRGSRPRALGLEAGGEGPGAFSRVPSRVGLREERRGLQRPSMTERRLIYREPGKPRRPPRSQGTFLDRCPSCLHSLSMRSGLDWVRLVAPFLGS